MTDTRRFRYYLHDGYTRSEFQEFVLEDQLGIDVDEVDVEELMEGIGRPFYEVAFDCELDLETGNVTFKLAEGVGS